MPDHITPEQHVAALCMPFAPSDDDSMDTRFAPGTIPDVLYAVSARVEIMRRSGYLWTVYLPTFYLDSRVQGIVSEAHARDIVMTMLAELGHDSDLCHVQVTATLGPCEGRG